MIVWAISSAVTPMKLAFCSARAEWIFSAKIFSGVCVGNPMRDFSMAGSDSSGCRKKSPVRLRALMFVSASILTRKNFPPGTFFMASYFTVFF